MSGKTYQTKKKEEIITFKPLGEFILRDTIIQEEPSCYGGHVKVRKFKITIELIDEPLEVIQERLQTLWDNGNNLNDKQPLEAVAKKYGVELKGIFGNVLLSKIEKKK